MKTKLLTTLVAAGVMAGKNIVTAFAEYLRIPETAEEVF
jgi:hypothetical protein